jgi:divalent metal cation (Fe/Co/Zn/Cd) transporter
LIRELKDNKDPVILTVLVEDTAALLGIVIAAVSLFLSDITGNTAYDAIGSLLIGIALMAFALFLARENRGMLIGESISKRDFKKFMMQYRRYHKFKVLHQFAACILLPMMFSGN